MWMDVCRTIHSYVENMVKGPEGMKILLVDRETVIANSLATLYNSLGGYN